MSSTVLHCMQNIINSLNLIISSSCYFCLSSPYLKLFNIYTKENFQIATVIMVLFYVDDTLQELPVY